MKFFFLFLFSLNHLLYAELIEQEITYQVDDIDHQGFLVYPKGGEDLPGVLVVHEWWGHNAFAREQARALAELGYVAFAVDMYGEGKTADHPKDAGAFASAVFQQFDLAQKRFEAALAELKAQEPVDAEKIAAIGYCFGGGIVLNMARRGVDVDAVVSFHGSLGPVTPAEKGKVKARVLVANGANDPLVTAEQIKAFKEEMDAADVRYEFLNLEGALHSFTNPAADEVGQKFNLPLAYSEKAATDSWNAMKALFEEIWK